MAKINEAVKVGLIAGTLSGVLLAAKFVATGNLVAIVHYGSIISFLAGSYLAVKRTRDREAGENFNFKLGLKAGVTGGTIASVIVSIIQYFVWASANVRDNINEMRNAGVSNADIRMMLSNMTNDNFMKGALFLCITNIILAFFMSVMATMLLKRKQG